MPFQRLLTGFLATDFPGRTVDNILTIFVFYFNFFNPPVCDNHSLLERCIFEKKKKKEKEKKKKRRKKKRGKIAICCHLDKSVHDSFCEPIAV